MTDLPWWGFLLAFALPCALALALTPVAMRLATRHGLLDGPSATKSQATPVPLLGGAAIVIPFSAALLILTFWRVPAADRLDRVAFLALAVALAILGLVDDMRHLSPWSRLVLEVAAGIGIWSMMDTTWMPGPPFVRAVESVVWVVVVTNAFNLLDNMDGLAAGVAAISAVFIAIAGLRDGQYLLASLALALAGSATGFLRYNFAPARVYMGDAGSLFLGFVLSALTLQLRTPAVAPVSFGVPVLLVGAAIFDTTLVTVCRLANRRSPLHGGHDHVSHRIVAVGVSRREAVILIYVVAASLGCGALVLSRVDRSNGLLLLGLVVGLALAFGFLLGAVPVYAGTKLDSAPQASEDVTVSKHREPDGPEGRLLVLRRPETAAPRDPAPSVVAEVPDLAP